MGIDGLPGVPGIDVGQVVCCHGYGCIRDGGFVEGIEGRCW